MTTEIEIPQGSVEYLYADVTCDRILDEQPVALAIATVITSVDADEWEEAEWVGDPDNARSARLLLDGSLPAGKYQVFVRITDTPEVPIVKAGTLRVKPN